MNEKIKSLYIFDWVDKKFIDDIVKHSKIETFNKWDYVLKQWDENNGKAYIIIDWIVTVIKWNEEVNTTFEWDIFWEIALVVNEKRTASIRAESELKTLTIEKDTLVRLIKDNENWKNIQNTMINRIMMNFHKEDK